MAVDSPVYEHPALRLAGEGCLRPGGLALTRRALELAGLKPGARVLDLGCGLGAALELLGSLGFQAVGLDRSEDFLREAGLKAPVLLADAMRPPFADSSLDAVLCECVLSLLECKKAALGELARVLRPGGLLLLCDLHMERRGDCDGQARTGPAKACIEGAPPLAELRALLREAGFEPLHEEDHTRALKELAARLVLAGGPAAAFWPDCGARPGYALIIAAKTWAVAG